MITSAEKCQLFHPRAVRERVQPCNHDLQREMPFFWNSCFKPIHASGPDWGSGDQWNAPAATLIHIRRQKPANGCWQMPLEILPPFSCGWCTCEIAVGAANLNFLEYSQIYIEHASLLLQCFNFKCSSMLWRQSQSRAKLWPVTTDKFMWFAGCPGNTDRVTPFNLACCCDNPSLWQHLMYVVTPDHRGFRAVLRGASKSM